VGDLSKEFTSVQIKISARHGHLSDETQAKIRDKLEKLPRYYDRLSSIDVTVDLEHRDAPDVDLHVSADHKHDFVAECRSMELTAAIDDVVEKMEQQLRKYKKKIQDRHRGPGHRQLETPEGMSAEDSAEADVPATPESDL
jgi:putative sigma-54 modulation protein